jgi:hypothetical protein
MNHYRWYTTPQLKELHTQLQDRLVWRQQRVGVARKHFKRAVELRNLQLVERQLVRTQSILSARI